MNHHPRRELMDFCYKDLGTSIKTEGQVDGESYNLQDLLSSTPSDKKWTTEYFVKPPVNITLVFPHPIRISHISLDSRVGSQVTSIYDISHLNGQRLIVKSCSDSEQRKIINKAVYGSSNRSSNEVFYLGGPVHGLIFVIRKTLTSSNIPCIANLQVWGYPCCSNEHYTSLQKKWSDLLKGQKSVEDGRSRGSLVFYGSESTSGEGTSSQAPEVEESPASSSEEAIQLPNEFIDAITFDRMNIPMVLPSGNVIDKATLDRHILEESKWGRPPSDPFTWKLFSERSKPIFDSSLKTRIDSYVLKDSMPTKRKFMGEELLEKSTEASGHRNEDCLTCGKNTTLYRLPCRHLLCQVCILKFSKDVACSKCSKSYSRSSVTRYHFVPNKRFCS